MSRIFSLLLLLLCGACIQLGGEPQPTRYYLLEAGAENPAAGNAGKLALEISPIEFPSYLDRPQLVSRNRDNEILIAEQDRWAEPLSDNLVRTLQENLYRQVSGIRINSAPWGMGKGPEYKLQLIVNRFDGILGQHTDVDIRWLLIARNSKQEIIRKHFLAKLPINDDYQSLVEGLNSALVELSKTIAASLAEQH